ncbi:MAG: GDP-L-fucose synthase [Desulfobacteraceae bacterium]|nr:GDP-L-fucose synthase [Desulfobacteraceae bacterium]
MDKNSRIYVAGHRGLVGSAILRALQDKGYGNPITRTHRELDLTDQFAANGFFEEYKPEYVFLAAARVGGIVANMTHPAEFIRDNLLMQCNIIDAAYRQGTRKLLFLGSSCIYPKHAPQPIRETDFLSGYLEQTNEAYAIAKIAGIKTCQAYRAQYGFNAISVMPTNLYGPKDNFDIETSHVLPALIRKLHLAKLAMEGKPDLIAKDEQRFGPIPPYFRESLEDLLQRRVKSPSMTLWGTGTPKREFLHVDDLAEACIFLMNEYESEEIINIGSGTDLSIRELADLVNRTVGFEGSILYDHTKPDGTPRKLLDVSRINSLGWKPRISLQTGIEQAYDWYRAESAS